MSAIQELRYMLDNIEEKQQELKAMSEAWEGDDPCAAAESDPGLQYELGEEIDDLWREFVEYANETYSNS